jgi:outer membrane autotransporter protein
MKADGISVAAYASYQPSRSVFIDMLLGYGTLNFDTDRFVSSVDDFALAERKGNQIFGSVAAGVEYRSDGILLSPYGRLDFTRDKFKQATETGVGLNALTYQEQTQRSVAISLGFRAESQHATDFGLVRPRLRLEYRHDFETARDATLSFADQYAGLTYTFTPVGTERNSGLLGIGSDFIFHSGLRLGIDYERQIASNSTSEQVIRLLLSQELDGKGWTSIHGSRRLGSIPSRSKAATRTTTT